MRSLLLWSLGSLLGFLIGFQDFRSPSDDSEPLTLLLLAAAAGGLSFVQPYRAWRRAIPVGLGLPVVSLAAKALGYHDHFHPDTYTARLLVAPVSLLAALAGVYGGVLLSRLRRGLKPAP